MSPFVGFHKQMVFAFTGLCKRLGFPFASFTSGRSESGLTGVPAHGRMPGHSRLRCQRAPRALAWDRSVFIGSQDDWLWSVLLQFSGRCSCQAVLALFSVGCEELRVHFPGHGSFTCSKRVPNGSRSLHLYPGWEGTGLLQVTASLGKIRKSQVLPSLCIL